jgi:hypothetical protein
MANIPEGALRSDDGQYWWDGENWQPVDENAAAGDGDERVTARLANGYPASADDLTDEQKRALLGEPVFVAEPLAHEEVEVVAMDDSGHGDVGAWA